MSLDSSEPISQAVTVVGAGFAGLSAAISLAYRGCDVTVVEQLSGPGGRNRLWKKDGFSFEIGPSWVWMKEVHEALYASVGRNMSDYVRLKRLEPSYRMVFEDEQVDVPDGKMPFVNLIVKLELAEYNLSDASQKALKREEIKEKILSFLDIDQKRYEIAMDHFITLPSLSLSEFVSPLLMKNLPMVGLFKSQHKRVESIFKSKKVKTLLEWPVIFVGGSPKMIPEMYSILNYTAVVDGTLIPEHGMYSFITGLYKLAMELGVKFNFNCEVVGVKIPPKSKQITSIFYVNQARERARSFASANDDNVVPNSEETATSASAESDEPVLESIFHPGSPSDGAQLHRLVAASSASTNMEELQTDHVVFAGDMATFEQKVLSPDYRMYSQPYWASRVMSPSCLLFFVALNKKLKKVPHHILFFDGDLYEHLDSIYNPVHVMSLRRKKTELKQFTDVKKPLFYVNIASSSHEGYAPQGCESLFFLIPIPHAKMSSDVKKQVFQDVFDRFAKKVALEGYNGNNANKFIQFKRDYAYQDFVRDYHSHKGNAFGLSNSLFQTAFLKPKMKSSKIYNLVYVGQSVAPGGGIPPCIISGEIGAALVMESIAERKDWFWKRIPKSLFNKSFDILTSVMQRYIDPNVSF